MRILVMDMDIIMAPCIKLYNHMTDGDKVSPTEFWNTVNEAIEMEKYLSYDANILHSLHRIILNNPQAHIVSVDYSADVVKDMHMLTSYDKEQFDIVYIGWHHNASVKHEDLSKVIRHSKFKNSNWLGFLLEKDKVNTCQWFKTYNAPNIPQNQTKFEKIDIFPFNKYNELELYDIIYIVSSPQWVPYQYQHFVKFLTDTAKLQKQKEG